ncbi:hypothetical protein Tco_0767611 [Tanacetum coccineum]
MLNRHKNWLVHKQTACGKDFSNPFMVDNLPKIVGFSTHLASLVKSWLVQDQTVLALASPKANELTIPEQTATGKGTSNPLMADESIYDVWTRFKDLIQRVPHHGLDLWSLTQFFYDHVDEYTQMDLDFAADENLRKLSIEEAWEAIENFDQGQKEWDNPPNIISKQELANLRAQEERLFGNEKVWVEIPRPKEVEKVRLKDSHHLELIFQLLLQHKALSYHNDAGDGVRIFPDGVANPATVIFDEKKL